MRFAYLIQIGMLGLTASLAACSGVGDATSVFGKGSGSGQGAGQGGAGGTGSGQGGTTGQGGDTAGSTAASSSGDASSASSASASSSGASSSSSSSSASSSSSSGGGEGPTVYCADKPCAAGQVCCYHEQDPNQDKCGAAGSCGGGYITLSCNGPDDCPGKTCCGTVEQNTFTDVSCQTTCIGINKRVMCEGDPSVCIGFQTCKKSQSLGDGYSLCGNP